MKSNARMSLRRVLTLLGAVAVPASLIGGTAFAAPEEGWTEGSPQSEEAGLWNCPNGYSCYYDGPYGTGRRWIAPRCGFFNLGNPNTVNPVFNDKITSITNGGGGAIHLYNWVGYWLYLGTVPRGWYVGQIRRDIDNKIDAVYIEC